MITDGIIYIFSFILGIVGDFSNLIAKGWTVWPSSVLNGLTYFFTTLMNFNGLFPVDTLLIAVKFFIGFDIIYIGVKLLLKLFNWIRGASGIELN